MYYNSKKEHNKLRAATIAASEKIVATNEKLTLLVIKKVFFLFINKF